MAEPLHMVIGIVLCIFFYGSYFCLTIHNDFSKLENLPHWKTCIIECIPAILAAYTFAIIQLAIERQLAGIKGLLIFLDTLFLGASCYYAIIVDFYGYKNEGFVFCWMVFFLLTPLAWFYAQEAWQKNVLIFFCIVIALLSIRSLVSFFNTILHDNGSFFLLFKKCTSSLLCSWGASAFGYVAFEFFKKILSGK